MSTGTATIDFGDAPVKGTTTFKAVIGQASIVAGSKVEAWIMPDIVADPNGHSENEHMIESIKLTVPVSTIIAGTGFTIQAECLVGTTSGKFLVQWVWN